MMIQSYIPRITKYKTTRKIGLLLPKNNGNEKKTNLMVNANSVKQISYIEKKRNDTEIKTQLKNYRKNISFFICHILRKK